MRKITEKANQLLRIKDDAEATESKEEQSEKPHEQESTSFVIEIKP